MLSDVRGEVMETGVEMRCFVDMCSYERVRFTGNVVKLTHTLKPN